MDTRASGRHSVTLKTFDYNSTKTADAEEELHVLLVKGSHYQLQNDSSDSMFEAFQTLYADTQA